MSTDEYTTEMELYGVSPGIIAMIMFLVTIFSPFGFIAGYFFLSMPGVYGFFWIFVGPYVYLPLCFLNILFAHRIVRYYQGRSSRDTVYVIGLLSVLLPTAIVLYLSGLFGSFVVIYPIPIQFLSGLVVLRRIEGPEVISPWSGMRLELSWWKWWKWRQPKKKSDWYPLMEEKKEWLEE